MRATPCAPANSSRTDIKGGHFQNSSILFYSQSSISCFLSPLASVLIEPNVLSCYSSLCDDRPLGCTSPGALRRESFIQDYRTRTVSHWHHNIKYNSTTSRSLSNASQMTTVVLSTRIGTATVAPRSATTSAIYATPAALGSKSKKKCLAKQDFTTKPLAR